MKRDQQLVLAVEEIETDGPVVNRRRLEEDEQSPLLSESNETRGLEDEQKPEWADNRPWYIKPSVSWPFGSTTSTAD
jgi:hypothetical protein